MKGFSTHKDEHPDYTVYCAWCRHSLRATASTTHIDLSWKHFCSRSHALNYGNNVTHWKGVN